MSKSGKGLKVTNQQGDISLIQVSSIPRTAKQIDAKVLQFGEHSGHAHRFYDDAPVEMFSTGVIPGNLNPHTLRITDLDGDKYIKVGGQGAMLVHEEHRPQYIAPGAYRLNVESEVDLFSKLTRRVID